MKEIERMAEDFETGRLSRRQLVRPLTPSPHRHLQPLLTRFMNG